MLKKIHQIDIDMVETYSWELFFVQSLFSGRYHRLNILFQFQNTQFLWLHCLQNCHDPVVVWITPFSIVYTRSMQHVAQATGLYFWVITRLHLEKQCMQKKEKHEILYTINKLFIFCMELSVFWWMKWDQYFCWWVCCFLQWQLCNCFQDQFTERTRRNLKKQVSTVRQYLLRKCLVAFEGWKQSRSMSICTFYVYFVPITDNIW